MQFRVQGNRVQCIRATYDPSIKRARQVVVASFGRWSDRLPSDDLEALTAQERAELAAWWAEYHAERATESRKVGLRCLGWNLSRVITDVEKAADGELSAEEAAAAWEQIARLQKSLKRLGFPRPKKPAQPPVKPPLEGQGDLLDGATQEA